MKKFLLSVAAVAALFVGSANAGVSDLPQEDTLSEYYSLTFDRNSDSSKDLLFSLEDPIIQKVYVPTFYMAEKDPRIFARLDRGDRLVELRTVTKTGLSFIDVSNIYYTEENGQVFYIEKEINPDYGYYGQVTIAPVPFLHATKEGEVLLRKNKIHTTEEYSIEIGSTMHLGLDTRNIHVDDNTGILTPAISFSSNGYWLNNKLGGYRYDGYDKKYTTYRLFNWSTARFCEEVKQKGSVSNALGFQGSLAWETNINRSAEIVDYSTDLYYLSQRHDLNYAELVKRKVCN